MALFKPIYEEIVEASTSTWILEPIIIKVIEDVKKIIDQILESNENPNGIPLNATEIDDWKNIATFEELRKLTKTNFHPEVWNWSTEAVGSFFIKNLKRFFKKCKDTIEPNKVMELVNDVFTLPEQNLSLPDIALIYTANDFRVINKNNHFDGSKQLNKSLRDCLQDFHTHTIDSKKTQNLEIGSIKYVIDYSNKDMEPSPCLNLKKFPKCSYYCTLHEHFFEKTPLREFTTLMRYAMPQRKIR